MNLPDLILFDLDGTLISTEDAVTRAALEVMEQECGKRDKTAIEALVGVSFQGTYNALKQQGLYRSSPDIIATEIDRHRNQIFAQEGINFLPGVQTLLDHLQQAQIAMGVVTASRRTSVTTKCQYIDLNKYFDVIITADDVAQSKPNPDPYLKAHANFHHPERTVVFEDSLAGVQSAVAAKLPVIALVEDPSKHHEFSIAASILPHLQDTKHVLRTLCATSKTSA